MPQHLRALIVILVLAGIVFTLARRPALDLAERGAFYRRRNLWFGLTLLAFLAHNFWVYAVLSGAAVVFAAQREQNRLALFFFLLCLIPSVPAQIPGFGIINYLIDLDHARLMAMAILIPAFLILRRREDTLPFGTTGPDKLFATYLLLFLALSFRGTSATDALRGGFYFFIGAFLPYYVASRSLKDTASFRDALLGFLLAAMLQAIIGIFEYARNWNLYSALIDALGLEWGFDSYLYRAGSLRARAATGHPIVLGYVLVVAIGFYLFLKDSVGSGFRRHLGGVLLAVGLMAPLSRGPWVGAVALLMAFIATGRLAVRRFVMLSLAGIIAIPLLTVLPGGQRIIDLMPFIGAVERGNIDYRSQLIENATPVIQRNLWFGSATYYDTPELEEMRQGQGIIDVVNTYLAVILETGLIGLGLFVGFFTFVLLGIYKAMRSLPDRDDEMYRLGRALFATQMSILVIIFTVSSITVIPVIYWSIAGLGVAYAQMVRKRILAV